MNIQAANRIINDDDDGHKLKISKPVHPIHNHWVVKKLLARAKLTED